MAKRNQHVVPHDGEWAVRGAGSQRAITLSARPSTPRTRSPRIRIANYSSTVGMGVSGNATLTVTTRSCLPRRKLFAFLVVEVSQLLLR